MGSLDRPVMGSVAEMHEADALSPIGPQRMCTSWGFARCTGRPARSFENSNRTCHVEFRGMLDKSRCHGQADGTLYLGKAILRR